MVPSSRWFPHGFGLSETGPASFYHLRILITSYLATFLGTNSLSVLMCRKAVNQSIDVWLQHTGNGVPERFPVWRT